MVESAAVRDINEASALQGVLCVFPFKKCRGFMVGQIIQFPSYTLKSHTVFRALFMPMVCLLTLGDIPRLNLPLSVVRVRSREGRRNRAPPPRIRYKDGKKVNPAVQNAEQQQQQQPQQQQATAAAAR